MKLFASITILAVVGAIIAAMVVIGPPSNERARRFDDLRIQQLDGIQNALTSFWQMNRRLPDALADLSSQPLGVIPAADPQTRAPYEYHKKSDTAFSLCAIFTFPSDSNTAQYPKYPMPAYPAGIGGPFMNSGWTWDHAAGHVCFDRTINPDFFKPAPPTGKAG